MFITYQNQESILDYTKTLTAIAALSKLFSDNTSPYLGYRVTENIFCEVFKAQNLARADCSADAKKNNYGIGIKTFLNGNGKSLQKVAEFNKESNKFRNQPTENIIKTVSILRNERINFTKRAYGINDMIYHCLVRDPNRIMVYETGMEQIDINTIKNINTRSNTISFSDSKNDYNFNLSKSTLYKRFITQNIELDIPVKIVNNPYSLIRDLVGGHFESQTQATLITEEYVILPFFTGYGSKRYVPEKSGLNQWNAAGRKRDSNEIYIKIPSWIHKRFPNFFPDRDIAFDLKLPDGNTLSAKVCQQGNKALMSNPNKALGQWLLRNVLLLDENELLTYDRLQVLGIDSVIIYKDSFAKYRIDFKSLGSYDDFFIQHNY